MWGDTGFGGSGGGGFDSPMGGGFASPGPQSSQSEKKARFKNQSIIPVTIAQVLTATQTDDRFMIGDTEIAQITIVGLIKEVKEQSTSIQYLIDDMTSAPLEVRLWVESTEGASDDQRPTVLAENTYCRVFGHIRSFNEKINVMAFKMVPVTNANEITMHTLEVVHTSMKLKKKAAQGNMHSMLANGVSMSTGANGGVGFSSGVMIPSNFNAIQKQVYEVICAYNQSEEGCPVSTMITQLKGLPEAKIRNAIDFLSSEGHVYSTVDEDHYKSTDN